MADIFAWLASMANLLGDAAATAMTGVMRVAGGTDIASAIGTVITFVGPVIVNRSILTMPERRHVTSASAG